MHPALAETAHRPWPLPKGPWQWRQSWCDLLFAHWPIPAAVLRPLVPHELVLQEFDGTAWIALVPFRMTGVMRRPLPDLPWLSAFPELNVRTYVERDGKPGVWFLSLDASNPIAVWAAQKLFHLPYFLAQMSITSRGDSFDYRSTREGAQLIASYRPTTPVYNSELGSLEHWLTERYCLYAQSPNGTILRNDVHHAQWPLQGAQATIDTNTLFDFHGLAVPGPPLLHFSKQLDVVVWPAVALS